MGGSSENQVGEGTESGGPAPWGFWATLGFALLAAAVVVVVQTVIGYLSASAMLAENPDADLDELAQALEHDGKLLARATIATGIIGTLVVIGLVKLRRGAKVTDYLGLVRPSLKSLFGWLGVMVALVLVCDTLTHFSGHDVVPDFMKNIYETSGNPFLFVLALVLMAPLFEEFLFRGFLFAGWSNSKLGVYGTIVLTSLIFAAVHLQYDLFHIGIVFMVGLVLGIARHQSRSILVPIAMHALGNFIASLEVAWLYR